MQRVSPKLAADLENRAAFLVQLRSLLTQAKNIVKGNQKGRQQDLQLGLEAWVREVGEVGAPRPSICSPALDASAAPSHEQDPPPSNSLDVDGVIDGGSRNSSSGRSPVTLPRAASASTSGTAVATTRSPRGDALSSFTVDMGSSGSNMVLRGSGSSAFALSSDFESRNLEDFAEFLGMLFSSGLQEIVKLRSIGRNAARLVMVRCFSIITCALQQVLRQVYGETQEAVELTPKSNGEDNGLPSASFFIHLSRDIRIATNAVMKCLELLTAPTDALSMRFAAQVCVDVLKQLRQCVTLFVYRSLRGELRHLRALGADDRDPDAPPLDAAKIQQGAQRRAHELWLRLGPSLLASIEHLMSLVRPSVRYLLSVAAVKEAVSSPEERGLKSDVCTNVFALAQWVTPTSLLKQRRRQPSSGDNAGRERVPEVAPERSLYTGLLRSEPFPDCDGAEITHPLSYHAACCVVDAVFPVAFSPEFTACVAEHCGDQNEGQLVAVRVLNDTVKGLMDADMEEFRHVLGCSAWRKRIAEGILNCLVALEPAVLEAGLETLQRITAGCPECLGSEVGFVYTSGVFGLLESDSTPHGMRRLLLRHVISTFFAPAGDAGRPSLLLRLYQRFDLNVRWHQLNVVQQAFATLSKAVRCAAPEDFTDEKDTRSGGQEPAAPRKSLPFIALQGLSLAVELLSTHIPQDGGAAGGRVYARLPNRDKKLEEQRAVDVFNSSPVKGIKKLFDVADDEMHPVGYKNMAEKNWAHQHIPPPASAATDEKVHRIAQFLMETPSLNPESVAEFLSSPAVLPLQVCRVFMESLPVAGRSLVGAMRKLFNLLQLPKEGQRIERLLEFFCSAYFKLNSVEGVDAETFPFESENACFIAGVAVIMLNTNLHNPHVASAKMTDSSFYAQLRGCNEGKDFPEHFIKNIFHEVHLHSLSSMKGFWSAGMSSGVRYAAVPFPGKMDSIFFSLEERRELAFGVVRQRLLSETRELVYRHSSSDTNLEETTSTCWCCVAQDLFLSAWPSLCAVFGVAVHGAKVPEEALMLCVMGLRSSFLVAAAFGLQTECGVSQLALLRMASYGPMRDVCRRSVLEVAASPHSVSFSATCWVPVVELLMDIRNRQQTLVVEAETVFGRVEEFTRESCEGGRAGTSSVAPVAFTRAVQEVLQGAPTVLQDTSADDKTLSAAFYVLRRFLGYSLISHEQEPGEVVTNFINVRDFSGIVAPTLVDVVEARRGKGDEYMRLVVEFVVDVLNTVWSSCICEARSERVGLHSEVTNCFSFFESCYERCGASAEVRMHVLQGVKELIARTLHKVGSARGRSMGFPAHTLYLMARIWLRLLQPVARALSDKDSVGTETCSLAVHILRKLVVLGCGTGGTRGDLQLRESVRNILLMLLLNVSYVGGMCSDVDSAQSCLAQFSTICTTALNRDGATASELELPPCAAAAHVAEFDSLAEPSALLLQRLVESLQRRPDVLVLHSLERMSLLLCCHAQQTRIDVITALRALVVQLEPSQLLHLAVHLSDAVLEAALGHATPEYTPSMMDPICVSHTLFDLDTAIAMRRCSPTAFRATLSLALNFMSQEMLSEAPLGHVDALAEIVLKHCLVPLVVSPRSSFQIRTTAVHFLMHAATLCATRQSVDGRESCNGSSRLVAECVSLLLFALRIPARFIVPDDADHAGRQWVQEEKSAALAAYMRAAAAAVQALWTAEAYEVTGSRQIATLGVTERVDARVEPEELTQLMRSSWFSPLGEVATDEQLVEYCALMAQLLSPLPKVLAALPPAALGPENGTPTRHSPQQQQQQQEGDAETLEKQQPGSGVWTPPPADHRLLKELVQEAVGVFFAVLWRVNNVAEMEQFVMRATQKGRDAPSISKSNALLPHAAIRGGLNAFLALALCIDVPELRDVFGEVLRITATVQTSALSVREAQKMVEGAAETAAMQRLSPQEQQHIRSCNVGMYQELSSVVAHWVKTILQQTNATTSVLTSTQRDQLQAVAGSPEVFQGLVRLLAITAGAVIVAVRDYLVWYISVYEHDKEKLAEPLPSETLQEPPHKNICREEG
ncbi:uncharacterized protein Tco025E_01652 [Trypanosoma conorhini]|uniref:SEC7 domain-containing protein n=1 Tax=Trypanosoma conorhini TaxID=83891 RepID=A0A422Q886_9TRYP|nr:uncharacterized protein Tco025E_01652 [Trypanosoma conorhini]RNF26188.1 hypothetical protein Tco025E_01652 [Trypanosoma conorhini]